jgi:uncharacterized protein YkwD
MLYSTIEKEILQYINQYRTSINLLPLSFADPIQTTARKHVEEMAKEIIPFGHDGFDTRANTLLQILNGSSASENVALGQRSAEEVVESWLNSPQHKKNIEGDYSLTGIGVASNNQNQLLFTQIFIKAPSSLSYEPTPTVVSDSSPTPNLNYALLQKTNNYRQENQKNNLQLNPHLQALATQHAQEMANNKVSFGHDGFDTRANKIIQKTTASAVAENVALGNENADLIFNNWINSTPHQKNILGDFNLLGIGVAKATDGTFYYCQIFAKK